MLATLWAFTAVTHALEDEKPYARAFANFVKRFHKHYATDAEREERFAIFRANYDLVEEHNAGNHSCTLGINEFADLSQSEFAGTYNASRPASKDSGLLRQGLPFLGVHYASGNDLPGSVDWRNKGAVTGVKNQGQCGSCWAMTTAGAIEGSWQIATGELASLSTQQFVDCDKRDNGCKGGNFIIASDYATKNGICNEASYQYTAKDGTCQASKCRVVVPHYGVTGMKEVNQNDEQALMEAVSKQPVGCTICANLPTFQLYRGGVLSKECGETIDHAVLIVGYGSDKGQNYWLIKNSWGTSWGESGYVRLARGIAGPGECGIKEYPQTYVVVDGSRAKPLNIMPTVIALAVLAGALCICIPACILWRRWKHQRGSGGAPLLRAQAGQARQLGSAPQPAQPVSARPVTGTGRTLGGTGNSRDSALLRQAHSVQPSAPPLNT